ncbi:hypothetical protein OEZ86_001675 [Tetradesmus obliquus]|nr:hypothetical protein OEZ86_001675 [Tetradesmus obliquus]
MQWLHSSKDLLEKARRPLWQSGILCASLACVIFSFSSLQVKLTGGRVPVLQLCIIRSSISFCTSIAAGAASGIKPLFGQRQHFPLLFLRGFFGTLAIATSYIALLSLPLGDAVTIAQRQHFPLLFLRGFFGTLAIATSYIALLSLPLGDAVTIAQMRPPVTAVMARLLLNEPLGLTGAAGCLVSVAGVTILAHPPFLFGGHSSWGQQRLLGTLAGVASTLFASGTSYTIRRIGQKEPALVVALWFHTTTMALMVWPLLLGLPQHAKAVAPRDCLLLLGIATSSFFAQLLMTRSFQIMPAARAAAVSFTGVIYSHILGAIVFHEQLTLPTLAGGVLIFAGVLMVTPSWASWPSFSSAGGSIKLVQPQQQEQQQQQQESARGAGAAAPGAHHQQQQQQILLQQQQQQQQQS